MTLIQQKLTDSFRFLKVNRWGIEERKEMNRSSHTNTEKTDNSNDLWLFSENIKVKRETFVTKTFVINLVGNRLHLLQKQNIPVI